jgi:hypothetical protein
MTYQPSLLDALAARDEGTARVITNADDEARAVVEQVIRQFARRGVPFSSNDTRPYLPDGIKPQLVGACFLRASTAGLIRGIGYERSTSVSTHGHPVAKWIGTGGAA